jgi:heptosyltransferase-2
MTRSGLPKFRQALSLVVVNAAARIADRISARGSAKERQDEVARILVFELWNIGDVILAMPFLAQLRRTFPRAKISLASRTHAVELLAGTGLVDEFITADMNWTPDDEPSAPRKAASLWHFAKILRRHDFDVAFSSRSHLRERFLLALSGARRRVGFALPQQDAALTDPIEFGDARHRVEQWMQLLGPFDGGPRVELPRLCIQKDEQLWAAGFLTSRGVARDDLVIGIHPGASLTEKRWPLDRFREVAETMMTQPGVRVLAFAEPNGYGSELFAIPGVVSAEVELRQLMALIARCDMLVCNDSGPMHIAGALGVPTVAMFGSGIDQWFSPLGGGHEILSPEGVTADSRTPETRRGIRMPTGIRTAQVIDAVARTVRRLRGRDTLSRA